MREGLDEQMMRSWRKKTWWVLERSRKGSRRIGGRGQVLNIAPNSTGASWSQLASGLQGSCWSPHIQWDLWEEEWLRHQAQRNSVQFRECVSFQYHCFVKYQNDSLGAIIISSVGNLLENKHSKYHAGSTFCFDLHFHLQPLSWMTFTFLLKRLQRRFQDPFKLHHSVFRSIQNHPLHAEKNST